MVQQQVANAYPGLYQGITPQCSFTDAWSSAMEYVDYSILLKYFEDPSRWSPGTVWTPTAIQQVLDTQTLQSIAIVGRSAAEFMKIMPGMASTNGVTNAPRFSGQVIGINGSGNAGSQSAVGAFSANGTPTASTGST